jgi:hypothetical protein
VSPDYPALVARNAGAEREMTAATMGKESAIP